MAQASMKRSWARALEPMRDQVVIATKFGFRDCIRPKGRTAARSASAKSPTRCSSCRRTDRIDLFYQHTVS